MDEKTYQRLFREEEMRQKELELASNLHRDIKGTRQIIAMLETIERRELKIECRDLTGVSGVYQIYHVNSPTGIFPGHGIDVGKFILPGLKEYLRELEQKFAALP